MQITQELIKILGQCIINFYIRYSKIYALLKKKTFDSLKMSDWQVNCEHLHLIQILSWMHYDAIASSR